MTFDPNQKRDDTGKWTDGGTAGGSSENARKAIDWIKSDEARALIRKISAPDNVKAAATFAIQGALFKMGGINDPNVDVMIKHQVQSLADDLKVTRAHARQIALTIIRTMLGK